MARPPSTLIKNRDKKRFLEAYSKTLTLRAACDETGLSKDAHFKWMKRDPSYAEAFAAMQEDVTQALEAEAKRRAVDGVPEAVFYKGKPVGVVRKYSDLLLIFLLKARRPAVYRERYEVTGPGGAAVAAGLAQPIIRVEFVNAKNGEPSESETSD